MDTLVSKEEFRKTIIFKKRFSAWTGYFDIEAANGRASYGFGISAAPDQSATSAKPEIIDHLYNKVREYCILNHINFNSLIAEKMLAKANKNK